MASLEPASPSPEPPGQLTSFHVQRAIGGDPSSLEWVVLRLSPLLRAQAAYRLGAELRGLYSAEDLVQEAWLVLLPRLGTLQARDGRLTPVLLRFLATTLLHRVRNLTRKHVTGKAAAIAIEESVDSLAAETSEVLSKAARLEADAAVRACLDELSPEDREVLVLRGIEQHSIKTSALLLGLGEEVVAKRYQRALARLRSALPHSVFDELGSD
ncbi:MAG TPA: sigma-70 family RNA polymerase sigma factor [Planctomycetota bacterium]|nr:sigma-70 family RNA polymerase sigma factor [Planctomycetota bacterium]